MKLIYSTLSFLFLSIVYSQQQTPNYVNLPVTPEAAALAKMVNYPVNYNTGVPNINIPFYEINVGSLKLPITLNYHAGGFKINEQATRTGLGWSLSCDLQITQSINGGNDLNSGGYLSNNLLKSYTPYESYFYGSAEVERNRAYDLANGEFDGMPDKFNYQLLDKTGSFYFQKNDAVTGYSIVTMPYNNIKITYESGGVFKIIDTDGTTYYFGVQGNLDLDYLNLRKKEVTNNYVTSWKCDRVISSNKVDEITFSYIRKADVKYRSFDDKIEFYNNPSPHIGLGGDPYYGSMESPINNKTDYDDLLNNVPFYQISSPKYKVYHWNKTIFHVPYLSAPAPFDQSLTDKIYTKSYANSTSSTVKGISISEINYRGGKVIFNGADKLSSIQILDGKNNEIKSLNLFHPATTSSQVAGTEYLDSLHVRNGGNTFERYALLYNDKFNYGNHLKGHDVFGYPNESTAVLDQYYTGINDLSMPKKTILMDKFFLPEFDNVNVFETNKTVTIGGSSNWNETPNEEIMKRGILRQIIYPTGGSVNFDFEANKYQEDMHANYLNYSQRLPLIGGGLRIRSINYLDANATTLSKQIYYRYGDLEEGTGVLMYRPLLTTDPDSYYYGIENYEQTISYLQDGHGRYFNPPCEIATCMTSFTKETKTTYSSASSLSYTYPSGAPIYYTKVTEYEQDLGQQTGKTVYTYYKPNEFYAVNYPFIDRNIVQGTNIPYIKTDWLMGHQKSKEVFKYDVDNRFKLAYRKSFEYKQYLREQGVRVVYSFFKYLYEIIGSYGGSQKDLYELDYPYNFIKGEYALPMGVMYLSKESEDWFEDTGNKSISTSYFYDKLPFLQPSKILTTNTKGESIETTYKYAYDFDGVYDEMESANIISPLVEEVTKNVSQNKELSRKKINFEKILVGSHFFAPKTVQSSVKGGVLETDITIDEYDQFANVLQLKRKDGIPVSYLWGYHDTYPVAELKNVSYASIPSTYKSNNAISDPTSDASLNTLLGGLRTTFNGSTQTINTYTFKRQIGVTSITDAKEYSLKYDYDAIGRLKSIKDNNQKIIKEVNYYVNNFKVVDDSRYYNFPIMRSVNFDCLSGVIHNYVVPGGKYISASSNNDAANINAELEINNLNSTMVHFIDCLEQGTPVVSLELTANFFNFNEQVPNYPTYLVVDFIQDGSIVATQKFNVNTDYNVSPVPSKLFLTPGEYQLSFRMDLRARYSQGYIPDYSITTVEGNNKQYISQGDSFQFEGGKHYKLEVFNYR